MENLPLFISISFGITVIAAIWLFFKAASNSKIFLLICSIWILIQFLISLSGFYKIANTTPPRIMLLVLPPILFIVYFFILKKGKNFIDLLNIKTLTIFHIIRVPVEIVLFWLFIHNAVPKIMTFEGRNFDIYSGLTAPIVYFFAFAKGKLNKILLLCWNFICLGLLINIVFYAVLSTPTKFQQFAFDQPNIAFGYFPFILLPALLVPLVLLCHLASIRFLLNFKNGH